MANQLLSDYQSKIINFKHIKCLRLHSNKSKPKIKQEKNSTKSTLPPHLQTFIQKLLSGNGFLKYN